MDDWIKMKAAQRRQRLLQLWRKESNAPHDLGCACWDCVLELLRAVALSERLYRRVRRSMVPG
jgi:hypothetical protein